MTKLQQIAEAIAHIEGFYLDEAQARALHCSFPTIPQRCNNPGNLMFVGQAKAKPEPIVGRDKKTRTYCKFDTIEAGWAALYRQIFLDASRTWKDENGAAHPMDIAHFIDKYAPAADANDPKSYAHTVARKMGVSVDAKLSDVIDDQSV